MAASKVSEHPRAASPYCSVTVGREVVIVFRSASSQEAPASRNTWTKCRAIRNFSNCRSWSWRS